MPPPPPRSTLFPYTTLFRSHGAWSAEHDRRHSKGVLGRQSQPDFRGRRRCGFEPASTSATEIDRKSTRLNSSHVEISYAVFCLKKKKMRKVESREVSEEVRE